jgi:MFS family permease
MSVSVDNDSPKVALAGTPLSGWRVGTLSYTKRGLVVLFGLLLFGDFAWSMRDRSVGPMAQWYLNHMNVPNLVFGLLVSSFPAFVGLILGPIISVKSDRHRGKWGRRIPFLLVTTPLAAAGMIGLAVTPLVARWVHGLMPGQSEMLVSVVCFGVFWAAFEVATIAGGAVFGGLINDVVPKELMGRFYGLFRAVSLIDGMIFNYWLLGKVPGHFTLILLCVGVFYGAAFMWVCVKVKEGDYPAPSPRGPRESGVFGGARGYFRECFSNPYYLQVFTMLTAAYLAFGPINTFSIPYARSLGVDMDTYGKYLALTYLISLSVSYFLGWLADAFHPLRVSIIALIGYTVVTAWGWIFATTPGTFLIAWVAHGVLSGCFFTCAASLGQRLFPHEKFAQYASAFGMVLALGSMVLAPAVGVVIDGTGSGYRHAFGAGMILAAAALVNAIFVHRRFMRLGGPKGYVAPE